MNALLVNRENVSKSSPRGRSVPGGSRPNPLLGLVVLTLVLVMGGPLRGEADEATSAQGPITGEGGARIVEGAITERRLVDAVESGDQSAIEFMLAKVVDAEFINKPQVDGMTPLMWAAYHDDTELCRKLLDLGAEATATNRYGVPAIHLACLNGNPDVIEALLESGADPNTEIAGGETLLMTVARHGALPAVEILLEKGARVNAREKRGQTALMWAAAEGHGNVVECLVRAGAEVDVPLKRSGFTPFLFAVRQGHVDVVHRFLDLGVVDINQAMTHKGSGKLPRTGTTALLLAVENGHYDLAVDLLDAGADPNDRQSGVTILHALAAIRKPDIGESSAGDPKPLGSGRRDSLQFVRELAARGADVNARLTRGRRAGGGRVGAVGATPFFFAADRADLDYMKLLVELGADPLLPNVDGTTPLMVAAGIGSTAPEEEAGSESECLAAVKYITALGGDVNRIDRNGETAMHGAAYKNIPAVVRHLDQLGANINLWNQKNKLGWTPLLIAEGYRPGNFKPSFATVDAIIAVMAHHGVKPPAGPKPKHTNYAD